MTEQTECIHGLGPTSACVICNGREERERTAEEPWQVFPAKYDGWCGYCREGIIAGESIAWKPGGRAIHEGCMP